MAHETNHFILNIFKIYCLLHLIIKRQLGNNIFFYRVYMEAVRLDVCHRYQQYPGSLNTHQGEQFKSC